MADIEERRSLLGEEGDGGSPSGGQPDGEPGRPMSALCDPAHLLHRVVVLVFMCFLGFGESRSQPLLLLISSFNVQQV